MHFAWRWLTHLSESWKQLDALPVSKSSRAVKLLDIRAFELKSDVHDVFDRVWKMLVHVDVGTQKVLISSSREGRFEPNDARLLLSLAVSKNLTRVDEPMTLADAVIGLQAYKEVDQRMEQLWKDLNDAIFIPRMDINSETLPAIHVQDVSALIWRCLLCTESNTVKQNELQAHGSVDKSVESLFKDLEKVFAFLIQRLPSDLVETISSTLLPEVIHRITSVWLDSAVPASLRDMDRFKEIISLAKSFCGTLKSLGFSNLGDLQEWTESAPRVWLSKCRESALDTVRTKLSKGLGTTTQVEKIEKQMVSKSEGQQLTANGAAVDDDHGWGDAWDDGEETAAAAADDDPINKPAEGGEDDGADAWGWGDEATEDQQPKEADKKGNADEEDDPTAAWGWGDDGMEEEPQGESKPKESSTQTREMTLKEAYTISSTPQEIFDLISAIAEDGAALTEDKYANSPVASAAAGLFNLPTLVLAMFRAISPYYYSPKTGGNM